MPTTATNGPTVGATLGGKYQLVRAIGSGGMGAVYEANNTWTGRRVAIKVLRPEFATRPEVVERFKREARATTQIAHPNIVDVLDMGQEDGDGALFIVQEYLHGRDLRDVLDRDGPLATRDALDVLVPVMGALVAAHRRGVVHRDIKPENVFLARGTAGDVPKLIDFGIAKLVDPQGRDATSMTTEGTVIGTVQYMSPEQLRGDRDVDGRTDVWAVGIVLYECLAGACPFDAASINECVARVLTERAPRLDARVPAVGPALADVVERALEPDRARRFPTMRAMLQALLECETAAGGSRAAELVDRHKASIARQLEGPDTVPDPPSPDDSAPTVVARDSSAERPAQGRRRAAVAIGAALLLAAGTLVAVQRLGGGTARPDATRPREATSPTPTAPPAPSAAGPATVAAPTSPTAPLAPDAVAQRPAQAHVAVAAAAGVRRHAPVLGVPSATATTHRPPQPLVDPETHLPILGSGAVRRP